MKIRERLSGAWAALTGRAGPPSSAGAGPMLSGGPYHPDAFGARRAPTPWELVERYKSILFFCVNINASRVAATPLRLYAARGLGHAAPRRACGPVKILRSEQLRLRKLPYMRRSHAAAEDIIEVTNHPFLDLLDRPDPDGYFDRTQLIDMMSRYIDVVGSSYHKPVDYGAFPSELWPLQSQYVIPVRWGTTALIQKYTYFADNYPFETILRIRLRPSLHDPYGAGYAGAQAAVEYLGLEDQWVSIQSSVLSAGPRMGMIVSSDGNMPIGKEEGEKLEREMNAKFARGGAGRVWVNKTGLKAQPITFPPSDLAGMEISDYNLERACNCLDCPPTMFSKEQNLANIEAARELHAINAVQPRCHAIASALTRFLHRFDERLFLAFDPAVREDEESKVKLFDMEIRNGSMTRESAMIERGSEPYEGSETPLVGGGLVPVPAPLPDPAEVDAAEGEDNGEQVPHGAALPADGATVQDQVLNGAQIAAVVEVLQAVRDGALPAGSAKALLAAALPALDPAVIAAMVDPIEVKEPEPPAQLEPIPGRPGNDPDRKPKPKAAADAKRSEVFDQAREVLSLVRARLARPLPGDPGGDDGPGDPDP